MGATSMSRGHHITYAGGKWVYTDDGTPLESVDRACRHCHEEATPEGHDPCLGTLPGVKNACCGHGCVEDAYVHLEEDKLIQSSEALKWIKENKY